MSQDDIERIKDALDSDYYDEVIEVNGDFYKVTDKDGEMWQDAADLQALAEEGFIVQAVRALEHKDGMEMWVGSFEARTKTVEKEVLNFH